MKNTKKILAGALALTLALSLAACSKNDDTAAEEQDPETEQTEQNPEAQPATPEELAESTDYSGDYQDRVSQRAVMTVAQDGENLSLEITWGSSAFETSVWTMSGTLSEDGTRVDYTDGKLTTTSYGEPSEAAGEEKTPVEELVIYENGTGHFDIADGVFTWVSDNDTFAQAPEFEQMQ